MRSRFFRTLISMSHVRLLRRATNPIPLRPIEFLEFIDVIIPPSLTDTIVVLKHDDSPSNE